MRCANDITESCRVCVVREILGMRVPWPKPFNRQLRMGLLLWMPFATMRRRINSKYRTIMRIPRTWLLRMHSISPVPKSKNLCLRLRPRLRKILCSVDLRLCTKHRGVRSPLHEIQHNRYHDLVLSTVPVHIVNKRRLILKKKWTSIRLNPILPEFPFWVDCACAWPNYRTRALSMYHPLQFPTFHAMMNKNPWETKTNELANIRWNEDKQHLRKNSPPSNRY